MSQGSVTVNNLNLAQGEFPGIERKALFIGVGTKNMGSVQSLNALTDFNDILGVNSSAIKTQALAAKSNGGENWFAYAYPINNGEDWRDALDDAMQSVSVELVVVCTPAVDSTDLDDAQAKAEALRTTYARRVIILQATAGIDDATQSWADYVAAQTAITNGVAADRIAAVPLLHGNELGALAGRLCNRSVGIADSPMRVKTGAVLSLGAAPVDVNDDPLSDATLAALDAVRLTVLQRYPDYPGTYFGDCNLLDVPGGDYQVVENMRVVDKAARAVRVLAIQMIGNRSINNTPVAIAYAQNNLSRPLRDMSRSTVVNGIPFPGDIQPPADDAITLVWKTLTELEVYIKVQPYNAPKIITANILLDLKL